MFGSSYSVVLILEKLGRHSCRPFLFGPDHYGSLPTIVRRCRRRQNDLLTGYPSAGQCWGRWLQKGSLRPSVSVHDDLFNAPYKVADQHPSPAALRCTDRA